MFKSNSEREAYENARATPITDQLASVPADARQMYEHSTTHHQNIPFGRMAADALAEIQRLQSKLGRTQDALRALLARSEAEGWAYSADEREAALEALQEPPT